MRVGDLIATLTSDGDRVLDETDSNSKLVEQLDALEAVDVVRESDGAVALVLRTFDPSGQVASTVVEDESSSDDPDDAELGATLEACFAGAAMRPVLLVLPDVEHALELGLFELLARAKLEIVQACGVQAGDYRHALLVGPSSGGDAFTLRARNEARVVWMVNRTQSVRLRQLRAQVRSVGREQGASAREIEAIGREREVLAARLAEAERARDAFRVEARKERSRANAAEAERAALRERVEGLERGLADAVGVARKARSAMSFRLGRASKKVMEQAGRNPLKVVDAWRDGFSGDDEVIGRLEGAVRRRR